jgi:hypothetical protein
MILDAKGMVTARLGSAALSHNMAFKQKELPPLAHPHQVQSYPL